MTTNLTPEQKMAILLQKEREKYRNHCSESHKFTQNPQNAFNFDRLVEIQSQMKQLKEEYDNLRANILQEMQKCLCGRAINLKYRKQLTISSGKSSSRSEFDLERFKMEQPEMYERYKHTVRGCGVGGVLVCRDITDKAYKHYSDPENSKYFRANLDKFKPQVELGDLYTMEEFKEMVVEGLVSDFDGFGRYYNENTNQTELYVNLGDIVDGTYPEQYNFVVWYNK